jgi:hypothetical protein
MGASKVRIFRAALCLSIGPITAGASDSEEPYRVDSPRPKSIVLENDSANRLPADSQSAPVRPDGKEDTLELPGKTSKPAGSDSISREFKKYWAKVEKQEGFDKLRSQIQANDIDKTWVPHFYLFDSNLVIFPGWFVLRKKH